MDLTNLTAISPIDGRYHDKVKALQPIFSEYALMRFRLWVEINWLISLCGNDKITEATKLNVLDKKFLLNLHDDFSMADAEHVKNIEKTTNHDVKAIEYFLKEKSATHPNLVKLSEFIHFACTSEDINNLSYALMLKTAKEKVLMPLFDDMIQWLKQFAHQHAAIAMLGRTHGQTATPTTVGKEIANVVSRLYRQFTALDKIEFLGKINGAIGNYNAHICAYPEIEWISFCQSFVENLGLTFNPYTTQIEPHDFIAELCHVLIRINTILIDLARDIWGYISLNYFKQKIKTGEVGSSTMPHKVNPIDFENAEGNLSLANAILDLLSQRLPISRWQRDLVDSTLLRNLGSAIAYCVIGYQSLLKGLNKLSVNETIIKNDLMQHWEVLAEPIQTVMRRYGVQNPYEQLKTFSHGQQLDEQAIKAFISQLALPEHIKQNLLKLTPENYIGLAIKLAQGI